MRTTNKLTPKGIESAKPKETPYKLADGEGLFLYVTPSGGKVWRFKYRFAGKEGLLSLGKYPAVSIKMAREKRTDAKRLLAMGVNPAAQRRQERAEQTRRKDAASRTFEKVALDWLAVAHTSTAERYKKDVQNKIHKNLLPCIGHMPINEIEATHLVDCLRLVEGRGAVDLAHRLAQIARQIFRHAWAAGLLKYNPASDLVYILQKKKPVKHLPAMLDRGEFGNLLTKIEGLPNTFVRYLLKISPYVFVRPSEIRTAEWSEIDFSSSQWIIPAHKTKKRREHIVPLSPQVAKMFNELKEVCTSTVYCFPSSSGEKPLDESTARDALRKMGYGKEDICLHGFRTTASTWLNESALFRKDVIEMQLAHVEKDKARRPYNRAEYLEERTKLMRWWADYLDSLKRKASQ